MAEGEGDHPLLDQHAVLIGHPRHPAFPLAQDLGAVAIQLPLPAVIGGGVNAHGATRGPDIAQLCGDGEHS
jgi:hypothetical protein